MIMIDTSAWIEFLRDTGSTTASAVDEALASDIAVSDPIRMELLAGARDDIHLEQLRRLLSRCSQISATTGDFENAALLYRQCRGKGATVRKLTDCLIAAIAIRAETPILHLDSDFDALEEHTSLTTVQ